jgi:hypothetical protein
LEKISEMKKGIFLLVLLASMVSCENDSLVPSKVTAFINGDTWKSLTQVATVTGDHLTITATDAQGRILILETSGHTIGTYTLGQTNYCAGSYKASPTASTDDIYVSTSGTITLTTSGATVSGTFDLVCARNLTELVTITNGQFTSLKVVSSQ